MDFVYYRLQSKNYKLFLCMTSQSSEAAPQE